jgi:hypothetical protein|tara:strand:- start:303 stop:2672 length:2370 start_codon:yes stop_codon:yes gene_type:complete
MAGDQVKKLLTMKQLMTDQNRLLAESIKLDKDRLGTDKEILSTQMDIDNVIKDQVKQLSFQKAEKSAILRATNSLSKITENLTTLGKEDLTNAKSLNKLADNRLKIDKDIRLLKQTQSKLTKDQLGLTKSQVESNYNLSVSLDEQIKGAQVLKVELGLVDDTVQNIANAKGVSLFGGIEKVLEKVPLLSGLAPMFGAAAKEAEGIASDMEKRKFGADKYAKLRKEGMGMKDALEASGASVEDIQKNMKGGFSKGAIDSASLAAGAKGMLNSFMKSLGPVALLTKLIGAMIEGDKAASEMAKGLNMSYKDTLAMRGQLRKSAVDSGNIFVSTKGMSESMMEMNKALGTSVKPSKEMLIQFTEMREMAGFTNEELLGIKAISDSTGKSLNEVTGEYMAQAKISSTALGVKLNEKDLLKDIGNLSASTTLSLGKNPGLIADAVASAKALGMEMSKVDDIAGSLLDFESSIEAELEAELLLGKDINLEKARQAALNNDLATVAKEISEQAGSAAEFGEMNRIQQEALAKAVGMGRDDLAQTLFIQEQLVGATGEQAAETEALLNKRIAAVGLEQAQKELAKDGVEGLKQQVGQADKMSASMNRINEIFGMIGESMMPVFEMLGGILEVVGFIIKPFMLLMELTGKIGEGISNLTGPLGTLGKIMKGIVGIAIVLAAYMAFQSAAAIPFAGFVLGPIAAAATLAAGFGALSKVGDMNSPADGKTQVSTKEGGLFELSKNDDFIAAPGASKMMQGGANSGGTTIIQSENKETKETNKLLKMIGNKLTTVDMYQVQ